MQKTALKEVAKAFSNYVANLQGSDGSPEATAEAAGKAANPDGDFLDLSKNE